MSTEAPRRALYERREIHERERQKHQQERPWFFDEALRVSQGFCPPEHEAEWARVAALFSSELRKPVTVREAGTFAIFYKLAMDGNGKPIHQTTR